MELKEYIGELEKSGKYNACLVAAHNLDDGGCAEIGMFGDMFNVCLLLGQVYFQIEKSTGVEVNDIGDMMVLAYAIRKQASDGASEEELDKLQDKFMNKFLELFGIGGKYDSDTED